MYSVSADEIWELFSDYVEGNPNGTVVALSSEPLPAVARNALEKSFDAFGYGAGALAYVTLEAHAAKSADACAPLDPQAQFLLLEGLDPVCLIACDHRAVASLAATYRTSCAVDTAPRIFGRPCVLFNDLASLLATDSGKQRAWSLLKTLPKM